MPVLDGYAATQALRKLEGAGRRTPVIGLSAHALTGDRDRALGAGMDDYIVKPLTFEALSNVLDNWLTRPELDPAPGPEPVGLQLSEDLMRLFVQHAPDQVRDVVRAEDVPRLRTAAHKLKGTCMVLGLHQMASAAADLEAVDSDEDLLAAQALRASLLREFERVRTLFEKRLAQAQPDHTAAQSSHG